jgi:hypothetical protein
MNLKYRFDTNTIYLTGSALAYEYQQAKYEKNMQILSYQISSECLTFLIIDWYTFQGIKFQKIVLKDEDSHRDKMIKKDNEIFLSTKIPYSGEGKILLDNGSFREVPMLSFSTPIIRITENMYFGVGHSKIKNNYTYDIPKVEKFKDKLHSTLYNSYGDKYIPHFVEVDGSITGSIYLIYFYYVIVDPKKLLPQSMKISNSYYFLLKNDPREYHFSLLFPLGLTLINNEIIVTAGEGDFYSIELTFNLDECLQSCVHDVQNFDFEDYDYYLSYF